MVTAACIAVISILFFNFAIYMFGYDICKVSEIEEDERRIKRLQREYKELEEHNDKLLSDWVAGLKQNAFLREKLRNIKEEIKR